MNQVDIPLKNGGKDAAAILKGRAQVLARTPEAQHSDEESIEVVEFLLAHERYAIETAHVEEVYPLKDLTPLPCTPAFVQGIINVRGQILAVIDVRIFFDLPKQGLTDLNKVIILRQEDVHLGMLADTILNVRAIPLSEIQSPLPTLTGIRADYIKGVTAERLVILDGARLLADERILVHEEVDL